MGSKYCSVWNARVRRTAVFKIGQVFRERKRRKKANVRIVGQTHNKVCTLAGSSGQHDVHETRGLANRN
jgi:hypothetical protein